MFRSRSSDLTELAETYPPDEAKHAPLPTSPKSFSPLNQEGTPPEVIAVEERRIKATSPWWFSWVKNALYLGLASLLLYLIVLGNRQGGTVFLTTFLSWVESIGVWGNFMFGIIFVVISFPFVVGGYTPLTLGAGALYGVLFGTITVSLSSVLGASVSFFVSRFLLRDWIEGKLRGRSEFDFFMSLFAQARENKLVCVLMRLSPIPFGIQNSLFAVTEISFKTFFLSTWVGLLPFQVLWCHFGTTMAEYSKASASITPVQIVSMVVQLLIMLFLFVYLWWMMRQYTKSQNNRATGTVFQV